MEKVVDDLLAFDASFLDDVKHLWTILASCRRHGITLNPSKFQFAAEEVKYVGYYMS